MGKRRSNPPPRERSRKGQVAYGVYEHGGEKFYRDINRALARAAFLSGTENGEPVRMRIYEADGEGGWLWGQMFSISTVRAAYELPEGAKAANPQVFYNEDLEALIPNLEVTLTPAQYHSVITLVREHRASGAYGSNLESWQELEETLTKQGRAWAEDVKRRRRVLR